jgi:hypothetical protein
LIERGTPVGIGTVHRFFARHGITRKKRPGTRSSRTGRTFRGSATTGSMVRWISIRNASC